MQPGQRRADCGGTAADLSGDRQAHALRTKPDRTYRTGAENP